MEIQQLVNKTNEETRQTTTAPMWNKLKRQI